MKKMWACAALTICAFVAIPSDAQQGSESGVDFLGIYAPPIFDGGGPPRRRPDVLPLSDEGRQAVADYDPILDNPRIQDDCALESMPRLLWTGNPIELRQGRRRYADHPLRTREHGSHRLHEWRSCSRGSPEFASRLLGRTLGGRCPDYRYYPHDGIALIRWRGATKPGGQGDGTLLAGTGLPGPPTRTCD